ncbi:MAG: hypothetical protein H0V17_01420 [Deltaproteobacteria bacterium]|nr:hypothetical protein [Deltaproteobacteria bacterium]
MGDVNKRSQAILRMPVDMVDAYMTLHDGDRSDVLLFVPPTEDLSRMLQEGDAFLAVMRDAAMCFVARTAIACLRVAIERAPKLEEDFPAEEQRVKVTLRNGGVIEGVMKWIPFAARGRTGDHLNSDSPLLVITSGEHAHLIVKSHIAMVREA